MLLLTPQVAAISTAVGLVLWFVFRFTARRTYRNWQQHKTIPPARTPRKISDPPASSTTSPDNTGTGHLRELIIQPTKQVFPFRLRPPRDPSAEPFHITEMVAEPPHYLNASNANMWLYQTPENTLHFVVSGHANGPVCRDISSLLFNTYMELADIGNAFLVPGASYLQEQPLPEILGFQAPPTLHRLAGDIRPFHTDIGLAQVSLYSLDYDKAIEDIKNLIIDACQEKKNVMLSRDLTDRDPHAIFLPYYRLTPPYDTVTFQLPLSLFGTEDFTYLKEVQHRQIVREMLADAQRRKHIYKNWLHRDQKMKEIWDYKYSRLSEVERNAQDVHITGQRDYINAKETDARDTAEERYTSPKEYVTQILPGLIESDNQWISHMDELMNRNLNMDNHRGRRLGSQNIALLIDSFLRGWPSIFLGGEKESEDRQRYDRWCKQKRPLVWRMIHRQLERKGLSSVPLTEENTIFHVKLLPGDKIMITPLHLALDPQFLVYLSSSYGVTYYLNLWDRRKHREVPFTHSKTHLDQALWHISQGAQLLETPALPGSEEEETQLSDALSQFKLAMEIHPASVKDIWNRWWATFSRDTQQDFDRFKYLVKAIKLHDDGLFEQSGTLIRKFLQYYPDYLPDPYVLLAIHESSIANYMAELIRVGKEYRETSESFRKKVQYLESNSHIIRKLEQQQNASKLVFQQNSPWGSFQPQLDFSAGIASAPLSKEESRRVPDILRITKELETMRPKMERIQEKLKQLDGKIDEAWESLEQNPGDHMVTAVRLAPQYVAKIMADKRYKISDNYSVRFQQILQLLKADDYVAISDTLFEIAYNVGKKKLTIHQVSQQLAPCFKKEYLLQEDLKELEEYRQKIEDIGRGAGEDVSVIIRESIVKEELRQIANDYFWEAEKIYEDVYLIPEFRDPLIRLTGLYTHHYWKYRKALNLMVSAHVAVRNFAPRSIVTPLTRQYRERPLKIKSYSFHRDTGIISGRLDTGDIMDLAKVENLTAEEAEHLERAIAKPDFSQRARLGIDPADCLLNAVIPASPHSQRWSKVIQRLEPWLLRLIAYLHIPPIPAEIDRNSEMVRKLEGQAVVEGVEIDLQRIQTNFLEEIGISPETVTCKQVL